MKRMISAVMAMMLMLALVGCGNTAQTTSTTAAPATQAPATDAPATEAPETEAAAELSGTVSTDGSTSMEAVIGALGEAFMEANPDVNFTYNPTGSGSGIQAVQEGRCDIGLSSRALKDEEKESGLTETVLCYDGIAVIINPANTVEDLTVEHTAVSQNPGAIGYASLASVKDTVKAVKVDGVAPSEATVKDESYKIQRPFVLATQTGVELSPVAQAFFDYITSADANEIIVAAGVVPAN